VKEINTKKNNDNTIEFATKIGERYKVVAP
jgi:hypothetical protein